MGRKIIVVWGILSLQPEVSVKPQSREAGRGCLQPSESCKLKLGGCELLSFTAADGPHRRIYCNDKFPWPFFSILEMKGSWIEAQRTRKKQ